MEEEAVAKNPKGYIDENASSKDGSAEEESVVEEALAEYSLFQRGHCPECC